MNQRVLRLIKEMKQAQHDADHARSKAMCAELTNQPSFKFLLCMEPQSKFQMSPPPPPQKTAILRVMCYILRTSPHKAWERQAIKKVMCVVRTSPHTVQSIFSKQATKMEWAQRPPNCTCAQHIATVQ